MKVLLVVLFAVLGLAYAQQCAPDEFTCDNGRCVPDRWICDGDNDCGDGSDERGCPCNGFKCNITERCIPASYQCDGDNDCGEWEDETDCPNCGGIECNRVCIPPRRICDGNRDCADGSDEVWEPGMPGFACPGTGVCMSDSRQCDGNDDCGDGWDESEELCPCARETDVRCGKPPGSNVPGPCIPPEWVCDDDGIWDCPDGSDEANCTMSGKTHPKLALRPRAPSSVRQSSLRSLMKLVKTEDEARSLRKKKELYDYNHPKSNKQ